jgi:DHA1 family bicyclomycin/chloramphenicol resistance-like MFS transporter
MTEPLALTKPDFNPRFIVFFVALLLSFQPLSTDLYLPSLQMITQSLSLSVVQAQGTLLGLLLGFAVSQLFWGQYSDRIGRRRILLVGALIYTLSAALCTLATSGTVMMLARVAMGCGLAALVVCARALIRDLFDEAAGQQAFAKALTGMAVTATLSGVAGGVLARYVPWRGTMGVLALLGAVVLLTTWRHFDESHEPHHDRTVHWLAQMGQAWRKILASRTFLLNTGLAAFTYTEAILFIGGSSLVMVRQHGVKPEAIGLFMTAYSACFLAGTVVCRQVLKRGGLHTALRLACGMSSLGWVLFVLLSVFPDQQITSHLVMAQMIYMLGHGFNQVCSQAGAVAPFPKEAGTAAALSGTLMILCTVALGQLQAMALTHTPMALTWFSAFNALMAALFGLALLRGPVRALALGAS